MKRKENVKFTFSVGDTKYNIQYSNLIITPKYFPIHCWWTRSASGTIQHLQLYFPLIDIFIYRQWNKDTDYCC